MSFDELEFSVIRGDEVPQRLWQEAAKKLFRLPPSKTMCGTGEFFNPNFLFVDEKRRLVCHKEQFPPSKASLPGEYLVRDRRFTANEITNWLDRYGFSVVSRHFVRAGFKVEYGVSTGKKILIFARKDTP
ncbi:MAG: hypothetical protein IJU44_00810 [Kiritimatiellae bacterium]|nr:hypothetical protein [Kiritimatiellia bacterium]